jgi:hypothetical protein
MAIDLSYFNPFSKYFRKGKNEESYDNDLESSQNSQGLSEDEINFGRVNSSTTEDTGVNDIYVTPIHFNQVFTTKMARIRKYREMEQYPEISEALDIICDESIVVNNDGRILDLNFKKEIPKAIQRKITDEFDYIVNDVIRAKDRLWNLYRKFLVEGEVYLELILNKEKTKIIGIKPLASFSTFPVYSGNVVVEYVQTIEGQSNNRIVSFDPNQIAYVNWGKIGNSQQDVRGFLDPAIRPYNQLKN